MRTDYVDSKHSCSFGMLQQADTFRDPGAPGVWLKASDVHGKAYCLGNAMVMWFEPTAPVVPVKPVGVNRGTVVFEACSPEELQSIARGEI